MKVLFSGYENGYIAWFDSNVKTTLYHRTHSTTLKYYSVAFNISGHIAWFYPHDEKNYNHWMM